MSLGNTATPSPFERRSKVQALLAIMRFDKPIGTFLLAAPTAWALVLANRGIPPLDLTLIFAAGVVVMRAAGCTVNDLADRNLDGFVERTQHRPLVTGELSVPEALALLAALMVIALGLVAMTNTTTLLMAPIGAALAMIYPFMKRVTHLPQVILGSAFSWSIPMGFTASVNALPPGLWWLFAANLLWTVVYDTQYAMVDREDDLAVGIKSTAILFGEMDLRIIGVLQTATIGCFIACGLAFELGAVYYSAIALVGLMFLWHQWLIRDRLESACFKAFNQSKWIGAIVLAGLVGQFSL